MRQIIEEQNSWIPWAERAPEDEGYYLVTTVGGTVRRMWYKQGEWYDDYLCDENQKIEVTAWMLLPEPYDPLAGAMNPPEGEQTE